MADLQTIYDLKALLQLPLPGWEAQKMLMPEGRGIDGIPGDLQSASVLIALYPHEGEWFFPLIKRSIDGFAHSGQIALPGGRHEGSETSLETALREAEEEINLPRQNVEILGMTSPLPIPISRYLVQPVVGFVSTIPELLPDPREVEQIFSISLEDLHQAHIHHETRQFRGKDLQIPFFKFHNHKIWGATAMILSEFRVLISKVI